MDQTSSNPDLSIVAGKIVTNALQLTRNLFCPYCAEAYMFEFTLKEHLKKSHPEIINNHAKISFDVLNDTLGDSQHCTVHNCPFCGAVFTQFGLIPKHITEYHGTDLFKMWQEQSGNFERLQVAKQYEPTITYAACSPGLSEIFDKMDTGGGDDFPNVTGDIAILSPSNPLKSILKKTPSKMKIINSPSSAAIRRSKSEAVKRSISVRRELRFDPGTKKSPINKSLTPPNPIIKSHQFFKLRNLFKLNKNSSDSNGGGSKIIIKGSNKLITSTPINCLDDDDDFYNNSHFVIGSKKNWRASMRSEHRPLFFGCERFQCAHCKKTWDNNDDLLIHLRAHHKSIKHWLRPQYRCSVCGATFYSNNFLVRHCHLQHTTPVKVIRKTTRIR